MNYRHAYHAGNFADVLKHAVLALVIDYLKRKEGPFRVIDTHAGRGRYALTSKEAYRKPFEPLPGDVTFVPYGDADALAAAVTDRTAAILLEPIQGEAGVNVPPDGYLAAARAIADEHGALLWLDEIQSGMGRTGEWFAHDADVRPDIVTVAKGLGGGFPIGACIGLGDAGTLLEPGNHGTTFGGNPVACAAALAVIRTIEDEDLLEHVIVLGQNGLKDGQLVRSVNAVPAAVAKPGNVEGPAPKTEPAAQTTSTVETAKPNKS